jgi:hypothetical protein
MHASRLIAGLTLREANTFLHYILNYTQTLCAYKIRRRMHDLAQTANALTRLTVVALYARPSRSDCCGVTAAHVYTGVLYCRPGLCARTKFI